MIDKQKAVESMQREKETDNHFLNNFDLEDIEVLREIKSRGKGKYKTYEIRSNGMKAFLKDYRNYDRRETEIKRMLFAADFLSAIGVPTAEHIAGSDWIALKGYGDSKEENEGTIGSTRTYNPSEKILDDIITDIGKSYLLPHFDIGEDNILVYEEDKYVFIDVMMNSPNFTSSLRSFTASRLSILGLSPAVAQIVEWRARDIAEVLQNDYKNFIDEGMYNVIEDQVNYVANNFPLLPDSPEMQVDKDIVWEDIGVDKFSIDQQKEYQRFLF